MKILVFNCGSSSLKYRLIEMPSEKQLANGEAQRVGPKTLEPARIIHKRGEVEKIHFVEMPNHFAAFKEVMKLLSEDKSLVPDAIGHRLVHGGTTFSHHVIVDAEILSQINELKDLAPLHNPPAIELVNACNEIYPDLPQAAVFDTVFHSTIPDYAFTYALPKTLSEEFGFRKYGFHGISHQYVSQEAAKMLQKPANELNAVSCHLGSGGASLCAIINGQSIDNTMGFSPLQGLIMSTRCGDLDPAVTLKLLFQTEGDFKAVEDLLNKKSGVLGLSQMSADIRDVLAQVKEGSQLSSAGQVYLWRLRKYLGAYLAVVDRPDAIIFTDTIGETIPLVRWTMCTDMEQFGIIIDSKKNTAGAHLPIDIAAQESNVRILVIQTNEELAIARAAAELFNETACVEGV